MATYLLRDGQNPVTEYHTTVQSTTTAKTTDDVLTESKCVVANVTGTLVPGLVLTESDTNQTATVLWVDGVFVGAAVSDVLTVGKTLTNTDAGVSCTLAVVDNLLQRTADTPDYQSVRSFTSYHETSSNTTETYAIDVRAVDKVIITVLAGFLRLCNRTADVPLSPWIGAGRSFELRCDHQIQTLVLVLSTASETVYSIAEIGERKSPSEIRFRTVSPHVDAKKSAPASSRSRRKR
jgi:hypothetical protein